MLRDKWPQTVLGVALVETSLRLERNANTRDEFLAQIEMLPEEERSVVLYHSFRNLTKGWV